MGTALEVYKALQSGITGNYSGNNYSNNTTSYYGVQVPSRIPETFQELVQSTCWWVSPPEVDLDHLRDKYNLPEAGTGRWIFGTKEYKEWRKSTQSKLLWIRGGPGTGKTMLAKRVAAEFLGGLGGSPGGVQLAFHFVSPELPTDGISVDETESPQLRLAKVASDLLYSILQQDGTLFDGCKAELEKQGEKFFTNPSSLWRVLGRAIQDCRADPVYILIDGVDGFGTSLCEELIRRILGLMKIRRVKIFLSSRDVPHVSNNLPRNPAECLKINLDTNCFVREDVETFIERRVNAWGWDDDLRKRAIETLLAKSEGIFLWASLAIKSLACLGSGPDFDKFLRKPPLGLQEVYRTMLHTLLSREESEEVLSAIWSVALALRPLTFSELGHIMACIEGKAGAGRQPTHRTTSGEIRPRAEAEIRMYVKSALGFLRATDTTVSIVHHTAREYLFDENSKGDLPLLSKSEADLSISWGCFRYLHHAFGDPEKLPREDVQGRHKRSQDPSSGQDYKEQEPGETPWEVARGDPEKAAAKWPYLMYAAESWFIHARRSIMVSENQFYDGSACNWLQYQFFETSDVIRKPWIELCGDPRMEILAGDQTPAHIAVSLGLIPLVEKALPDLTEVTDSNRSLLHLAAEFMSRAHKILIDKGELSFIMAPDPDGNTPLHEAVIFGHWSMLKALVNKIAKSEDRTRSKGIDKKNHSGNTPLHLAFQFDRPEMVKFLVEWGADTNIKNNAQLTASGLGERLGKGDSLDILQQAAEIWGPQAAPQASPQHPLQVPPHSPLQSPSQSPPQAPPQDPQQAPLPDPPQAPPQDPPQPPPWALSQASREAPWACSRAPPQDFVEAPPWASPQGKMDTSSGVLTTTAAQTSIGDTINDYGIQVPSCVPASFEDLVARSSCGVPPPEIDLGHLRDENNLPEAGTGKWIFAEAEYTRWRKSPESKILWLYGGCGVGKTMLTKLVAAEFLRGPDDAQEGVKLGFHFVSPELRNDRASAGVVGLPQYRLAKVASDLLYGILQQDKDLFDGCKAELEKQGDRLFTNPCSLWKVLRKVIQDCRTDNIYILIDGVDGFGEVLCRELIGQILHLMSIRKVKILLASRDLPHISNQLPNSSRECAEINLDTNKFVKEDVETFIKHRVNALEGWDDALKESVAEALLAKGEGTFLWASLTIGNIACLGPGPGVETFLEKPPSGLEDIYAKMLSSLSEREGLEKVLSMVWSIALALRPLTFSELGHILACIEEKARAELLPPHGGTSNKIRPRTEEEIRACVKSSLGFLRATDTTVSIVHHTAIEYLLDENRKGDPPVLSKSEADSEIAWECFLYLHDAFANPEEFPIGNVSGRHDKSQDSSSKRNHQGEEPGGTPCGEARRDPKRALGRWPYLRYAAESWFIRARLSIEVSKDKFCDDSARNWLQYQFFGTSDIIRKPWIALCGDPKMAILAGEQMPLRIAVCLGLTPLVEKALSGSAGKADSNQSPLHLAAKFMSREYKSLIAKGGISLLTAPDRDGNTPLHRAVIAGHQAMLVALVEKFATLGYGIQSNEINRKNLYGNTPLHLAFQFDHPDIVRFLIENGADPTINNNALVTALKLGERLGRGDSFDFLGQGEKIQEAAKKGIVGGLVRGDVEETPDEFWKDMAEGAVKGTGVEGSGIGIRESEVTTEPLRASELLLCIFFTTVLVLTMYM